MRARSVLLATAAVIGMTALAVPSATIAQPADLAVLSSDYLTIPVAEIGGIRSLLTMVGSRVVYAAPPYAELEDRHAGRP